ncbi:MAG: site-specific DNA-methyltransferase, partial [Deltaproteobacteria bacterium]|nr:site-specific DNA-methyltransferase [Deltaproteobacteria bacterium]
RDRLVLCRELLADLGSVFVQISDENLHRVRMLLDEVFGPENFVSLVTFSKTAGATVLMLPSTADYILWYAKKRDKTKFRMVFSEKKVGGDGAGKYDQAEIRDGQRLPLSYLGEASGVGEDTDARVYRVDNITSQSVGREKGEGAASWFPVNLEGGEYRPTAKTRWKTNEDGMKRLLGASRVRVTGNTIGYVRFLDDFAALSLTSVWDDIGGVQSRADPKVYVVQTATEAIKLCIPMTTDPGDLVLDPTCGSGTTAYVAEQWGRRWVTIDTSRVALALARQRLLTTTFPFHKVREGGDGTNPSKGFVYKTVPHITLKSIAQNTALDPIFARHEPVLAEKLAALNAALSTVTSDVRRRLQTKLLEKEKREGKRAVTDADRRRWNLPKDAWKEWEVPFDTDEEWPEALRAALTEYRATWRAKMDEVNACIAANAEQEELVDQPEAVKGVVRVSGPSTMEAVMPPEQSLSPESEVGESPIGGAPEELDAFESGLPDSGLNDSSNAEAYVDRMIGLLRGDGVRFPNNKAMAFVRLEASPGSEYLHAEGEWRAAGEDGETKTVAVSFGPQFGPVTATRWRTRSLWRAAGASRTWSSPASPSMPRPRRSSRRTRTPGCVATWPTSVPT